jgi:CheY-specific phosphatase CheX
MMLDLQVRVAGPATDARPADAGLIALVGITGEWNGSGVFCCSPMLASLMSSRVLGTDFDMSRLAIDEDVLDVVAEVTNMTIGNVKNILEQYAGPLAISVPTVIYGRNFEFRNGAGLKGTSVAFRAGEERFEVRVVLAPSRARKPVRSRIPVMGMITN